MSNIEQANTHEATSEEDAVFRDRIESAIGSLEGCGCNLLAENADDFLSELHDYEQAVAELRDLANLLDARSDAEKATNLEYSDNCTLVYEPRDGVTYTVNYTIKHGMLYPRAQGVKGTPVQLGNLPEAVVAEMAAQSMIAKHGLKPDAA